jgi:CRP-like cAMP-binding protein
VLDPAVIDQLIPHLRQVGLFSRCDDYQLGIVARACELRSAAAGDTVIARGEQGSEMFVLLSGTATATDPDGTARATFGPGDVFGELAALLPAERTSDVRADSDVVAAVLGTNEVYLLVDTIPGVARKMLEGLAGSLRGAAAPWPVAKG